LRARACALGGDTVYGFARAATRDHTFVSAKVARRAQIRPDRMGEAPHLQGKDELLVAVRIAPNGFTDASGRTIVLFGTEQRKSNDAAVLGASGGPETVPPDDARATVDERAAVAVMVPP